MTLNRRLRTLAGLIGALTAAACATTPPPVPPQSPPEPPRIDHPAAATRPGAFADLPGWAGQNPDPALEAFERSCAVWMTRGSDEPISGRAPYAGRVGDWTPACAAVELAEDAASARIIIEALFVPVEVDPAGTSPRFTGYFEPEIEARRTPSPPFTEPIRAVPSDLVQAPASLFGGPEGIDAPAQTLGDGRVRPYPTRAEITAGPGVAIAYGRPADVFFLQIQGSGRLTFADGDEIRAAYGAHNGRPFRSTANWLIAEGEISRGQASMQGIRAWMARARPERLREALNVNPRYVFFEAKPLGDPNLGPNGAQGVPLTPLGSIAVDPSIHALGAPMYVQTNAPGLGGDWAGLVVAQDTGGAIKGPVRGDLYFGTGAAAGDRAGTMNAPGRMWVLLPRAVAERLYVGG